MPRRPPPQNAEILGLRALGWLAGQPDSMEKFLAASGTDAATLRQAAGEPALLGAVLEFLLAHEELLVAFCEDGSIPPAAVHAARHRLEGPCE